MIHRLKRMNNRQILPSTDQLTYLRRAMHRYFIKTPWLVRAIFSSYTWKVKTERREVFLTFDDGPHPVITPWVLEQLKAFDAKATFFCIGNNVEQYPEVYRQILAEGHAVGNHTFHHLNGWKTADAAYLDDIQQAAQLIHSSLFRPPYGRIKRSQAKKIPAVIPKQKVQLVMWDVLSADFDVNFSPEQCLENVLKNYGRGSVIVFHDSQKAWRNLEYILPKVLLELQRRGFACNPIS